MTEKHAGGRPRKFQSVEEMSVAIDAYFVECDERIVAEVTKIGVVDVPKPCPYTMSGLAEAIGISRRRLIDYTAREDEYGVEFRPTITHARARVEHNLEERMYDGVGSARGHEFGLKNNFDWRDTHDVTQKTSMTFSFDKARAPEEQEDDDS